MSCGFAQALSFFEQKESTPSWWRSLLPWPPVPSSCQDTVSLGLHFPSAVLQERISFQRSGENLLTKLQREISSAWGHTLHRAQRLRLKSRGSATLATDDDVWALQDGDVVVVSWDESRLTEGQREGSFSFSLSLSHFLSQHEFRRSLVFFGARGTGGLLLPFLRARCRRPCNIEGVVGRPPEATWAESRFGVLLFRPSHSVCLFVRAY